MQHDSSVVVENAHLSEGEDKENIRATFPSMLSRSSITLTKKVESEVFDKNSNDDSPVKEPVKEEKSIKEKFKVNKLRYLQQNNIYEPFISKELNNNKGIF